jgi:CubicO group peptidase (beta-lactamase class C family)
MAASADLSTATTETIDSFMTEWLSDDRIPGASLAVVDGDELAYSAGYGARELASNTPATPRTLYGVGSCSKSFAALAVMQLAAAGELAVDDAVDDYLPHLEGVPGDSVAIHELLTHSSGMPSDGSLGVLIRRLTGVGDIEVPVSGANDFRRHVTGSVAERRSDEEQFFYYNAGYTLLGLVVEAVSGADYADYVREHILDPLGMDRSGFSRAGFEAAADRMVPYYRADGETVAGELAFDESLHAPGGLYSSVEELATYLTVMMHGGQLGDTDLVATEQVARMHEPHATRGALLDGTARQYGYGWGLRSYLDDRLVSHGGMMGTTTAAMGFLEDAEMGVTIGCNITPEHHPTTAMLGVLALLCDAEPTQVVPQLALDEQAAPLSGSYESYRGVQSATVERDGADLTLTMDGYTADRTMRLQPTSLDPDDRTFEAVTATGQRAPVEFVVTAPGEVDCFVQRWRLHKTD